MNQTHSFRTFFFLIFLIFAWPCTISLSAAVQQLIPQVVAKIIHERPAFTQGLAIEGDQLYESTGLYGQSSLRNLDLFTGRIKKKKVLSSQIFAEGLAVKGNRIYQLTWKEHKAFVYDRKTFKLLKVFSYAGEGWGLCCDDQTLWMSDGTHRLVQRNVQTFNILKTMDVHQGDTLIAALNDLACDGPNLYANIFGSNELIRIEKKTGKVTGRIDASNLLTAVENALLDSTEVLNGIAFRQQTGTFFLTGKNWPWIFEVRFIPAL